MTNFADQLFDDLMREHGPALAAASSPAAASSLAAASSPAARRSVATRRTLLAAGTGFVAVAATVGGLMASGGGAPAYALTTHPDGTVTLDVYAKAGIAGINTKLHQVGDDQVVVVPVGAGCPSISSLPAPAVAPTGHVSVQGSSDVKTGAVTVQAQGIPAGDIMVVAVQTSTVGNTHYGMTAGRLTSPPAPSCVSLPASMTPPPGSSPSSGSSSGTVSGSGGGPATNVSGG
jgi:hypothetical protein